MRTKAGYSIDTATQNKLDAMSFALKRTKSELVEEGVSLCEERLSPKDRRAYDRALSVSER